MQLPTRILVATSNPKKVDEIRGALEPLGIEVVSLADAGHTGIPEPDETERTFAGNARLKAIAYAKATGHTVLADDSGLEVDALGGEPGVDSAIWAGTEGDRAARDARNNAKLVAALRGVPAHARAARFVCTMCVASPDGTVLAESRGSVEGSIVDEPRGANGFGYDPHFLVRTLGRTTAELQPHEKNAISHRGQASREIARLLAGRA
ncbi:MAG: RdgB/HAM1 family non-canonical purine NTP pyrophosphatase [Phycisphaerales bacterium]|nr:RdgB/HAM1 family non-canonical purine NTP pyrophosphatase [Phycisphaerales bacterium]